MICKFMGVNRGLLGLSIAMLLVMLVPVAARSPIAAKSTVTLKGDFRATGDGVSDDTEAFFLFLAACQQSECHAERGRYRITRRPPTLDYAISLRGDGTGVTVFIRDYSEILGYGFFHFEGTEIGAGGSLVSNLTILSGKDHTGGSAISVGSRPEAGCCNLMFKHINISTLGSNSWDAAVSLDGSRKRTGAKGVRGVDFIGCRIFGAGGYSIVLNEVISFTFVGGGTYAAGGTHRHSGGIKISGSSDTPSQGIVIIGDHFGYFNLSHTRAVKIMSASGIAGNVIDGVQRAIDADDTVDRVQIFAEPFGKVTTTWTKSSIFMPDGEVIK